MVSDLFQCPVIPVIQTRGPLWSLSFVDMRQCEVHELHVPLFAIIRLRMSHVLQMSLSAGRHGAWASAKQFGSLSTILDVL